MTFFTQSGKIFFPRTGQRIPAGTLIKEGVDFRTLEMDSVFVKKRQWNNQVQTWEEEEKLVSSSGGV